MPAFRRLAWGTVVAIWIMVVMGVIVRANGWGMGCPDWPLCYGEIIPRLGDTAAWGESIHRWWAVIIGFLILGLVAGALRGYRGNRAVIGGSFALLGIVLFQGYLGKVTVEMNNSAESVTAHLATAMVLFAVAIFVAIRSGYPAHLPSIGRGRRLPLLVGFSALGVYALMLFGTEITCRGVAREAGCAALIYPDWPLFGGQVIPAWDARPEIAILQMGQFAHRIVALIVGLILAATTFTVWRAARTPGAVAGTQGMFGLVGTAAVIFVIQVVVGAFQIFTRLDPWAITLHLALGAILWGLLVGAVVHGWYAARAAAADPAAGADTATAGPDAPPAGPPATLGDRVRAYVALTKPRIIELLLVTTLPAMILAWSTVDGVDPLQFAWLAFATLVGGSLAAGAANAINCYLDRDIDEVMTRTRRRPLPAHAVGPEDALLFGLLLTVISFAFLVFATNLVAAFLTLLAIGFYVVVYTMLLKRTTPQNIVLGGAAGALPPVIGWAAVTGDITLPALLLFAIVFYWTPPHFWALSLRIRGDYAAAAVPMLPVTHGVPETTRQIALYSVLMVALTLVFFAVAEMGALFLAGALVLGGLFLFQAFAMWREGTDARAVRLYKYSISYLTGLFALIILDVAVALVLR
ncbi:MAG: heme o synthase [Chloroflexota bacterium]